MPECIIKYDSSGFDRNLACLGTSGDILSVSDGAIRQWTRAGKPVGEPFDIEGEFVHMMAVSPDRLMVAGAYGDGRVRLWNIKEGSLVGQPWEGNNDGVLVQCLDWSPNGAEVAGGSKDGTIRRWNTTTGRQIGPPIKKSDAFVWSIKYSPRGDKFASGSDIIHQ
jgi:WD40 repeat protein